MTRLTLVAFCNVCGALQIWDAAVCRERKQPGLIPLISGTMWLVASALGAWGMP